MWIWEQLFFNMNTVYTILTSLSVYPLRKFKGETDIVFQLSSINPGNSTVISVEMNFADGTNPYRREYDFSADGTILNENIVHTFVPKTADNIAYYPTLTLTYSDFTQKKWQMPMFIYKESFYSEYNRLYIHSTQFIDTSSNDIFAIFESSNGETVVGKLKNS